MSVQGGGSAPCALLVPLERGGPHGIYPRHNVLRTDVHRGGGIGDADRDNVAQLVPCRRARRSSLTS